MGQIEPKALVTALAQPLVQPPVQPPVQSLVFEQLETDRTIMRPFKDEDLIDLSVIFSDPQVMQHTATGRPKSSSMSANYFYGQQDHQELHGFSLGAVIRRSDDRLIGQCGLAYLSNTDETILGYTFAQDCWGYGYATETTSAWLEFAFGALQLEKIMAAVKPENLASLRVLDKLGMQYDRSDHFYGCECHYYGINRDQWNAAKRESCSG